LERFTPTKSFIANYTEHLYQHNLLPKKDNQISNNMAVSMLYAAAVGVLHLKDGLNGYCTARKGTGVADPFKITFDEHVSRLVATVQTYDATNCTLQRASA